MRYIDLSTGTKYMGNPTMFESVSRYLMTSNRFTETLFEWSQPLKASVVIGANQNVAAELNLDYIRAHDIQITRRAGGGGAVYVDSGNLTYAFVDTDDGTNYLNFKKYATPIINVLKKLGVHAALSGRNDLTVDGKKFPGMAAFKIGNRFYCGGTLMVDVDLDAADKALKPPTSKLAAKGVKSVHSRVTNLRPYFNEEYRHISIKEIINMILQEVFETTDLQAIPTYVMQASDWQAVNQITNQDYQTDSWTMGKQYHDDYFHANHYDGVGNIEISFSVNDGIVSHAKIFGDFNQAAGNLKEIQTNITGVPFNQKSLEEAFSNSHLTDNIGQVTPTQMAELMLDSAYQDNFREK
ncbi:lipoate--protein ligase [Lentilactobacillus farraginis]|nr:lipoate--protein ligase [Lentilactobacillus farraginis]